MLFNSYIFLFAFLPAVFTVYFLLHHVQRRREAMLFLMVASILFYSYWNVIHLLRLLGLSMGFNYLLGRYLTTHRSASEGKRKALLVFGIVVNLVSLAYFKYADFLIGTFNDVFGTDAPYLHVLLPLGISFFTFTETAYLVDSYLGRAAEYSFTNYALFVSFFPHLIAGPIIHYSEMMPQFAREDIGRLRADHVARGLFLLCIGLFKKVCIADTFAYWATNAFDQATTLQFLEAWKGSLSYTLQLYFDFSGYSDMALGLALLFNIVLPVNFHSPYQALDIQDFWRRWHITLSRWLRDYLYYPLGGNRNGFTRTCINLFVVFLLGGIWHGAGWTFVVWGMLHGVAMVVYQLWRRFGTPLPALLSWFLTFNFVNVAWVFFRAKSFDDATKVLRGMAGLSGGLDAAALFAAIGASAPTFAWIAVFLFVVLAMKNSMHWLANFRPTPVHLVVTYALFLASVYAMNRYSEFIYFNF